MRPKRPISPEAARERMADLCAHAEHSSGEIRTKLLRLGLPRSQAAEIISFLEQHRFIDDSRFARAYIEDKARLGGWGPLKIRQGLAMKGISSSIINETLKDTDEDLFRQSAVEAASAKARGLDLSDRNDAMKLFRFLAGRGFNSEQASFAIRSLKKQGHD